MPRSPNLVWHRIAKYVNILRPHGLEGSKEPFFTEESSESPSLGAYFWKVY